MFRNPGGGEKQRSTGTVDCVHSPYGGSPSKLQQAGRRSFGPHRVLAVGVVAPAAWLLAGCSAHGGDLISTVALPSEQSAQADGDAFNVDSSPIADGLFGQPDLTPAQRGYLDALLAADVRPSNDLRALSIGAYVCQARAAGQSDQAVWESVAPMVRSDVAASSGLQAADTAYPEFDKTVAHYIAAATQKLC